ncbi:zinc finger BED domain-containing protein RICESLEEPER 2-like isoform X2 [Impatiens glandulifera]|uniref:zinc finger BED domain-containing protein RICESLEEPER 2-like isoform X2 n=1 Tax=Impatiens glandulifera TaxID=253017 RepID=UPI001FB0BD4B|nr:zinc finger BED domain-containing protein RICESLEEPER 2-like isoform X2 [Impatiens glandulifera]
MEVATETPLKKSKRLTSVVWNHFERVRKADTCYAVCLHCKKKLSGSSNSGTTHLRNHLVRCLKRSNFDVSQILSAKRKKKDTALTLTETNYDEDQKQVEIISPGNFKVKQDPKREESANHGGMNLGNIKFDQDRSRMDIARMVMLHGYPLEMVEHVGFQIFVKNLHPLIEIANGTIALDCVTIYGKEKQKVYELLHNLQGRVNIAVDMWDSLENAGCLGLTACYIDEDWRMQKKILNFITLDTSHTYDMLSEVIIKCLMDWDIDRMLFSMTFDNFSSYDDTAVKIKDWLSQNKPLLKDGQFFDIRCGTHVLRSMVQDAFEAIHLITDKIRESIRFVKCSQANQEKFNEVAKEVGIDTTKKHMFVDCPVQWNSTYNMLETALEYKKVFSALKEQEPGYTMGLTDEEWEWATTITGYIKLFVEVINVFKSNNPLTANICFPEICDVHIHLMEWCRSSYEFTRSLALKMKAKFDKYWNKCSLPLAVAVILDPRFKMKLVEYCYPQIYGENASNSIKEVSNGIRGLFSEYCICTNSIDQDQTKAGSSSSGASNGCRDRLRGFDKYLHETSQSQSISSDLDKYLEEPVFPRNYDFNILNWWRVHTPRYPILSMMARDILGIPVSTFSHELAFSSGGKMLDPQRSSLNPDIREALVCGQDWLRTETEENSTTFIHNAIPIAMEQS